MTPVCCLAGADDGDCYRAALATILNLSAQEVPNFAAGGADWDQMFIAARAWLAARGLGLYRTWCSAGWTVDKVLDCFTADNPHVPVILMGHSGKDGSRENHAVVALNGAIVHDPSNVGLDGPCLNGQLEPGWWYLDIVAFADFSRIAA